MIVNQLKRNDILIYDFRGISGVYMEISSCYH
jgi:hypothetical protein